MRVLGIDPGLTRCGVGVIEGDPGRTPRLLLADVIRTPSDAETGQRLATLERSLVQYIAEYRPDALAVERVFARRDVSTIIGTAQASGVVLLVGTRAGLSVAQHTPTEVKAALTGSGRADKAQVGHMVMRVLHLDAPPKPADAADAVALAVCHLWRAPAIARLEQARVRTELAQSVAVSRARARERKLG
jgi:crossover junction endodeoxyribonuclease RuvC